MNKGVLSHVHTNRNRLYASGILSRSVAYCMLPFAPFAENSDEIRPYPAMPPVSHHCLDLD